MIKSPALHQGDTVGLITPSDNIVKVKNEVSKSLAIIESWGLKTKLGKNVWETNFDFEAGSAEQRCEDLRNMIMDPNVKAIWTLQGGYGAMDVLSVFTPKLIAYLHKYPKLFLGYSDTSTITNTLYHFGLASLQAPNAWGIHLWDEKSREFLRQLLFGESIFGIGPENNWEAEYEGVVTGIMLVSNLDCLIALLGTRYDPLNYGDGDIILVIEEVEIELSMIIRWIDSLTFHTKASRIKGLVVGKIIGYAETSYPDWEKRQDPARLIAERIQKIGKIPVAHLLDFGHSVYSLKGDASETTDPGKLETFLSLPSGIKVTLTVAKKTNLEFLEPITKKN